MVSSTRVSFNLETFERNVKECNPQAMEYAASLGADLDKMESGDLARFRASISRYREDCTCIRIPSATRARAEALICEVKGAIETAKEKAAPTIEKIKVDIAPKIEIAKERTLPTIEKIKAGIAPKIEEFKRRYHTA